MIKSFLLGSLLAYLLHLTLSNRQCIVLNSKRSHEIYNKLHDQ